jgi:hypothetical protein
MSKNNNNDHEHPSYGVITLSRRSGSRRLFMSPVQHQAFLCLEVFPATLNISDFGEQRAMHTIKPLIEIELSGAQFGDMLSGIDTHTGAPCTIRYVHGDEDRRELPPEFETVYETAEEYASDILNDAQRKIEVAIGVIDRILNNELRVTKSVLREIRGAIRGAHSDMGPNFAFTMDRWREEAAKVKTAMLSEVSAVVSTFLQRTGLQALRDKMPLIGSD